MGRPDRKWQVLGLVGILGLIVVVCLMVPGPGESEGKKNEEPETGAAAVQTPEESPGLDDLPLEFADGVAERGNRDAKVKLEAFIPGKSGCGNDTAVFLCRVSEANSERVHLLVVDHESPGGSAYQAELGTSCSGLMINGKQQIEIESSTGRTLTIDFTSNLDDSYSKEEFLKALDIEFEKAYGEPANHELPELSEIIGQEGEGGTGDEEKDTAEPPEGDDNA